MSYTNTPLVLTNLDYETAVITIIRESIKLLKLSGFHVSMDIMTHALQVLKEDGTISDNEESITGEYEDITNEVASATTNVDNRSAIDLFLAFPSVSSLNSVQASWNIMVRQRPLVEGDSDEPEAGVEQDFMREGMSIKEQLMIPIYALTASVDALRHMPEQDLVVLRRRLLASPQYLAQLSLERKVVINPDNVKPDGFDLIDDGHQDQIGEHYRDRNDGMAIKFSKRTAPEHRWYTIPNGLRYSGICQGTETLDRVCPRSVPVLTHKSATSRQVAIDQWLAAYYSRSCSKVDIVHLLPSFA